MVMHEMDRENIRLWFSHVYNDAVEYVITENDILIRTYDNRLYAYPNIDSSQMILVTYDLDNITEEEQRKEFGRQLYSRLRLRGMMQNELADICGISQTAISYYMNGKKMPTILLANKIAQALDCATDDLILQRRWIYGPDVQRSPF